MKRNACRMPSCCPRRDVVRGKFARHACGVNDDEEYEIDLVRRVHRGHLDVSEIGYHEIVHEGDEARDE